MVADGVQVGGITVLHYSYSQHDLILTPFSRILVTAKLKGKRVGVKVFLVRFRSYVLEM